MRWTVSILQQHFGSQEKRWQKYQTFTRWPIIKQLYSKATDQSSDANGTFCSPCQKEMGYHYRPIRRILPNWTRSGISAFNSILFRGPREAILLHEMSTRTKKQPFTPETRHGSTVQPHGQWRHSLCWRHNDCNKWLLERPHWTPSGRFQKIGGRKH